MQERPEAVDRDRLSLYLCAAPSPADELLPLCSSITDTLLCQGFRKMDLLFLYNLHLVFTKCLLAWDFNSTLNSKYHFEKSSSFRPVYFHPCFPLIQSMAPISTANVRRASLVLNSAHCSVDLAFSISKVTRGLLLAGAASSTDVAAPAGATHALDAFSHELGNTPLFHSSVVPQPKWSQF